MDRVFVVGGRNNENGLLNSVEFLDKFKNEWKYIEPMHEKREMLATAVYNDSLYAIGGFNGKFINSLEYYDPIIDEWTLVRII